VKVHRLGEGESLTLDGKLDDDAWAATPWSDEFQDIEGDLQPEPPFKTKARGYIENTVAEQLNHHSLIGLADTYLQVKMRWDDTCLYIGAWLEEPQAWANLTVNNSIIYYNNDFEVRIPIAAKPQLLGLDHTTPFCQIIPHQQV